MTIANLVECLTAKRNALKGISDDNSATTFGKVDIVSIGQELISCGFRPMGKQMMQSGTTGYVVVPFVSLPCFLRVSNQIMY